jgi:hypothetical protein
VAAEISRNEPSFELRITYETDTVKIVQQPNGSDHAHRVRSKKAAILSPSNLPFGVQFKGVALPAEGN